MSIGESLFNKSVVNFSITVTSKCNLKCSYCHFYEDGKRGRSEEISQELFEYYVQFVIWLKAKNPHIHYRFSGGEPLVMGKRIFDLANYATKQLGEAPYIMTNGLLLNKYTLSKSSGIIRAYVVSMENPFDVDRGSIETGFNVKKIQELSSSALPLIPGAVIVRNSQFKNLFDIANYFYEEINRIPALIELNCGSYESPTDMEINDLYEGIRKIVERYHGRTQLRLFPYIVPEYLRVNSRDEEFLTELDYGNKYNISVNNFDEVFTKVLNTLDNTYISYDCSNKLCDWNDCCKKLEWVWLRKTNDISVEQKLIDYCRMKKAISNAYYDGISIK